MTYHKHHQWWRKAHISFWLLALCFVFLYTPSPLIAQDVASDLLGRINGLRADLGLSPYRINSALNAAASNHAQWMALTGQVSHTQPDGSRPRDRAQAAGYASSWVSENIYMGWNASTGDAWGFWINSPVHYAGLTSPNYQEIGISSAVSGNNRSFVLVFGNPGGGSGVTVSVARNSPAGNAGSNNTSGAVPGLPPFVVGVDSVGNIMHEVQTGDTLGDIALIYGYTWEDIPDMLSLNGLTQNDIRELEIGSIFLVPPYDGTYTPTPSEPTVTSTPEATATPQNTATPTPDATATPLALPPPVTFSPPTATVALVVRPLGGISATPTPEQSSVAVAVNTTPSIQEVQSNTINETNSEDNASAPPAWLIGAIFLQVGILLVAVFMLIRTMRQ
jgi:hypothetical protein